MMELEDLSAKSGGRNGSALSSARGVQTGGPEVASGEDSAAATPAPSIGRRENGAERGEGRRGFERTYVPRNNNNQPMERSEPDAAEEMEDEMDVLSHSKDRAQMTATSALSLSIIVLLKELLDQGPAANRYYYVSLSLVCSCLVLQVIIGILAIVMYQLGAKCRRQRRSQRPRTLPPRDSLDGAQKAASISHASDAVSVDVDTPPSPSAPDHTPPGPTAEIRANNNITGLWTSAQRGVGEKTPGSVGEETPGSVGEETPGSVGEETPGSVGEETPGSKLGTEGYDVVDGRGGGLEPDGRADHEWRPLVVASGQQTDRAPYRRRSFHQMTSVQHAITYILYIIFVIQAFLTGFGFD